MYHEKDKMRTNLKMSKDTISRQFYGETGEITMGEHDEVEKLFNKINLKIDLVNLSFIIDPITKHLSIWMHFWESLTFESPQVPPYLVFKGIRDGKV